MSIQRRAFGSLKNNYTPIIPMQSKELNSVQCGKEKAQKLNLDTPLNKPAKAFSETKKCSTDCNNPDLRCTYFPFKGKNFHTFYFL